MVQTSDNNSVSLNNLVVLVGWIAGIIIALAVGFGMIDKILKVRFLPTTFTVAVGWFVVILTIIGALLAIFDRMSK
mgnify:CR=1 FL=1